MCAPPLYPPKSFGFPKERNTHTHTHTHTHIYTRTHTETETERQRQRDREPPPPPLFLSICVVLAVLKNHSIDHEKLRNLPASAFQVLGLKVCATTAQHPGTHLCPSPSSFGSGYKHSVPWVRLLDCGEAVKCCITLAGTQLS